MTNEQCIVPGHNHGNMSGNFNRISWTAVIIGGLVGLGLSFLLNLFSVSIGLSLVSTTQEGIATLAIGGFIGLLIGAIISMFMAGFTAGYLGQPYCVKRNLGVLYGFSAWCVGLVLMVVLTSHITHYVAAYSDFIVHPTVVEVVNNNVSPVALSASGSADVVVNAQKTTNNLGITSLLIFILFFVGAVASCFGGHFGMVCKEGQCGRDRV